VGPHDEGGLQRLISTGNLSRCLLEALYMHLYFARNRQLRIKQNTKQIPQQHNTDSNMLIHIAIDMTDTNTALYY